MAGDENNLNWIFDQRLCKDDVGYMYYIFEDEKRLYALTVRNNR